MTVDPQSAVIKSGEVITITATLEKDGKPARGEEVTFSLSNRENIEALPRTETIVTDEMGRVTFKYTPDVSDIFSVASTTIMVNSQNKTATTLLKVSEKALTPKLDVKLSNSEIVPGGKVSGEVTLTNEKGPIKDANIFISLIRSDPEFTGTSIVKLNNVTQENGVLKFEIRADEDAVTGVTHGLWFQYGVSEPLELTITVSRE